MSLFNELKRRNVIRVAIAYAVVAWLILQIADVILNNVTAPAWAFWFILLLLGIGFILVVVFSWAFELTPEGLKREHEVDRSQSIAPQTGKKLDRLITSVLVLALGYFVVDKFYLSEQRESAAVEAALEAAGAQPESLPAAGENLSGTNEPDKSVAVLPFVNISSDPEQEYFSDGLSEELLNLLAKIPELRVAARTSSFSLKGKEMQISEVGQILKVAHVLEGSVRKSGDRVRITAQLIQANDGYHLWSETYDRELTDVFAIQDEIAQHVVDALKLTLLGAAPSVQQTNPEAYALVLQARQMGRQQSLESLEQALYLYQKSLEIAPDYPAAWAGLASVYGEQTANGTLPKEEGYRMAREAANKALLLDSGYAEAYAHLGYIALLNNEPESAARNLQKALLLEPANIDIITVASAVVELLGRLDEAIELAKYVVTRDPVNADGHAALARSYRVASRWDEAIAAYRTALALSPNRLSAHNGIAESLLFKGEAEAALAEYALEPDEEYRVKGRALASYSLGRQAEFEAALAELKGRWGEQWPSEVAHVYAFSGDADQAFVWLTRAVDQNEDGLNQQYYQPLLRNLRGDPRWAEFRARTIGTEEALAGIAFEVPPPR